MARQVFDVVAGDNALPVNGNTGEREAEPTEDRRRTGRIFDDVAVFLIFGGGYLLAAMVVTWLLRRLPEVPPIRPIFGPIAPGAGRL